MSEGVPDVVTGWHRLDPVDVVLQVWWT